MRTPETYLLLLFICFFYTSCKKEVAKNDASTPGLGEIYFQKGIKEKDPKQMLFTFEEGLERVDLKKDSISLYLLDGIIYVQKRQNNYEAAIDYTDSLIKTAELQKNIYFVALGYYRKAAVFQALNNSEEAFKNYYTSRDLFLQIGDSSRAGQRSVEMANAQSRMADYNGSQENATSALKLLIKAKDSSYINSAYNTIAISYRERGFYKDAIKEYRNALRYSISTKDSLSFLNNIALAYRDNGNYPSALSTFKGVLDKMEVADEDSKARFIDNYAYTKWMQDSTSPVLEELNLALELRLKTRDLDGLIASYDHLSNYYENTVPDKALTYAKNWLEAAEKNSSKNSELNALKRIIELSPAEGSKGIITKFIFLNDSLTHAQLKAKNIFAKIKFDEEQKLKEIQSLETLNEQQNIEAKQQRDRIIIISLIAIVIVLISGFLLYFFKQRHKKEKIREVYKTETRISKKIHDELANDIYNVMGRLEPIANTEVLDSLEHIYSRTRDISRENNEINTSGSFEEDLIGNLINSVPKNTKLILKGQEEINWDRLSKEKKIVIYRVLQELLVNMKKHSDASLVAIRFSSNPKAVEIGYSDNGKGFNLQDNLSGNGIKNVENRIQSTGGSINFETERGKGLKVNFHIPV